jgi:hypothetical protein
VKGVAGRHRESSVTEWVETGRAANEIVVSEIVVIPAVQAARVNKQVPMDQAVLVPWTPVA